MAVKARAEITLTGVSDGATGPRGPAGASGADGADGKMLFCTCSTAAATAAKTTSISGFSLYTGVTVSVKFTYANTASSPTLNVSSSGAKSIRTNGVAYAYWTAGSTVTFTYDGSYWQVCSAAIYANTSTIGNPSGGNVYIDGDSVDIRKGSSVLASFYATDGGSVIKSSNGVLYIEPNGESPIYMRLDGLADDLGVGMHWDGHTASEAVAYVAAHHIRFANSSYIGYLNDWVIEEGTSGIWKYRKWASGIAECWYEISYLANGNKNWGTTINATTNYVSARAYPFTFIELPVVLANCYCDNQQMFTSVSGGTMSTAPLVQAARPGGQLFTASWTIVTTLYAKGRWQ